MPNCENLLPMGKGGASVFCPLKSSEIVSRDTMSDGNYAASGEADIRQRTRGVTPTSDVNGWTKVKTNTGTTAATGVVTGARRGRPGVIIADILSCAKRRSGGVWPK